MPRTYPTTCVCALILYPSLAGPLDPLVSEDDRPVDRSELSLASRLQQTPVNAWLAIPHSAQTISPAPETSLPDCAAGITCKAEGEQGAGSGPVEDAPPL